MSFPEKQQTILCDVETCRHHATAGHCELESIKVEPRCDCHSGDCEESLCASYHVK